MFQAITGEVSQDESNCERLAFNMLPTAVEGVKFDIQLDESSQKFLIGDGDRWGGSHLTPCLIELGGQNDTNPFEKLPSAIFAFHRVVVKDVVTSNVCVKFIVLFPCLLY